MIEKQMDRFGFESDYGTYLKAITRLRKGDATSALDILYTIDMTTRPDPTIVKAISRCLMLLGKHTRVCDLVREKNMFASPSDWQVWYTIGISFFHSGNMPLAKDAFQRAIQSTNRSDPYLFLARCHQTEGDVKSAIFILRKASE